MPRLYARRGSSLGDRLTLRTDRSAGVNGCWPFIGTRSRDGYGNFWFDGKLKGAHVWTLIEASGQDLSATMMALHSCDNPSCCNPAHLRWGSAVENMRDMFARGRAVVPFGESHRRAKLTDAQVLDIRSRHGETLHQLAAEFGVTFGLISQIRNGRIWRHLLPNTERQSA